MNAIEELKNKMFLAANVQKNTKQQTTAFEIKNLKLWYASHQALFDISIDLLVDAVSLPF